MDPDIADLAWRGVLDANPWWSTGRVPPQRSSGFRRHAFPVLLAALHSTDEGRGIVVLGPRRVGKTVILHQLVEQILADGAAPDDLCMLSLDDVALRDRDLGELLELLEARRPRRPGVKRILLLDEVQHLRDWAGWLKRLADRRDPYVFLATGSSATALRRGGTDAGLGRWREMTILPWSFREHVELRALPVWSFEAYDAIFAAIDQGASPVDGARAALARLGPPPPGETERLDASLADYFVRGGFPEVAQVPDLAEARRRLRQDILDRALGRDVLDVMSVEPRALERMFLRICLAPGGLWNDAEVARDLGLARPTVAKYLQILEQAFLVFRLDNLASPVKGRSKVYLVAPALRPALLGLDEIAVRQPEEWGRLTENTVAMTAVGSRPTATQIGFWRKGNDECDVVVVELPDRAEYLEIKRSGEGASRGIARAAAALGLAGTGVVLSRDWQMDLFPDPPAPLRGIARQSAAAWLYQQRAAAGGTLRIAV